MLTILGTDSFHPFFSSGWEGWSTWDKNNNKCIQILKNPTCLAREKAPSDFHPR